MPTVLAIPYDVARLDVVTDGGKPEAVLANAPDRESAYFGVPKVVE